jgi:hypothetical protein
MKTSSAAAGAIMVALACAPLATSDEPGYPFPTRIFASPNGRYGLTLRKITRDERVIVGAELRLFTYDLEGREEDVWTKTLDFFPQRAVVSDGGRVATVDEWGRLGYDHALVVLGRDGVVLKDHHLDDLLSDAEIRKHVTKTVSNRVWTIDVRFDFQDDSLSIVFPWKKTISVDLTTGATGARKK